MEAKPTEAEPTEAELTEESKAAVGVPRRRRWRWSRHWRLRRGRRSDRWRWRWWRPSRQWEGSQGSGSGVEVLLRR